MLALLSLFGMFRAAKFWVAAVMALVHFVQVYSGIDLGLDQTTVTAILGGFGALLVWLVPNLKSDKPRGPFPPAPTTY